MTDVIEFRWSHGRASVTTEAGMLLDATFALPSGPFSPFARAPWAGADGLGSADLPGHLRTLAGEFVCVPFGSAAMPDDAGPEWLASRGEPENDPPHGLSADGEWTVSSQATGEVSLRMEYPAKSPVLSLDRTIRGVPGVPALEFELVVHSRRDTRLALGLHPIFRLPQTPGQLRVLAEFEQGFGYPGRVGDGAGVVEPGSEFRRLDAVSGPRGRVDLSRLPFAEPVEDVVQLSGVTSPVRLEYSSENAAVELDWDRSILPSILLWISDRGIAEAPWNGCYRGLGVEPIAAAFDLPDGVSSGDNPLNRRGIPTSAAVEAGRPLVIRYRISASVAQAKNII